MLLTCSVKSQLRYVERGCLGQQYTPLLYTPVQFLRNIYACDVNFYISSITNRRNVINDKICPRLSVDSRDDSGHPSHLLSQCSYSTRPGLGGCASNRTSCLWVRRREPRLGYVIAKTLSISLSSLTLGLIQLALALRAPLGTQRDVLYAMAPTKALATYLMWSDGHAVVAVWEAVSGIVYCIL